MRRELSLGSRINSAEFRTILRRENREVCAKFRRPYDSELFVTTALITVQTFVQSALILNYMDPCLFSVLAILELFRLSIDDSMLRVHPRDFAEFGYSSQDCLIENVRNECHPRGI